MPGSGMLCWGVCLSLVAAGALAETVNCKAYDYRSGALFNLENLVNKAVTKGEDTTYTVFPCGQPVPASDLGDCPFPHACQYADKMRSLGSEVFRDQLQPLVNGDGSTPLGAKIVMLNGTKCSDGSERSLEIRYYCGEDKVTIDEDFHCSYTMYVYSKAACPTLTAAAPPSNLACSVQVGESVIDLSPLKKFTGNHVIFGRDVIDKPKTDEQQEYEYIINVCQDINTDLGHVHESAAQNCHPEGSHPGICQVYYDNKSPFKPHYRLVGQHIDEDGAPQGLKYDAGTNKLWMEYTQGSKYSDGKRVRKGKIEFHCLENSGIGRPEFVRELDNEYIFSWTTQHACPVHKSKSSMSGGAIFALIMFVVIPSAILLYCIVGVCWNRQNGKTGLEMVPHIDTLRSVCGRLPGCSSDSTNGLSISADHEANGQSLMDDDYE